MDLDPYYRSIDQSRTERARLGITRAFSEFLKVPALIVVGALILAIITYLLDRSQVFWLNPLRDLMTEHIFSSPQSTSALLSTIAGGIITVTSITFSVLLLAVQQAASSMSSQIIDQFLRRQFNRVIFGFFIGLTIYALAILATINPQFNPIISATVVLLLSVVALLLLPLLIYQTINQVRPIVIINAIHDLILVGRERQMKLIGKASRLPSQPGAYRLPVRVVEQGFITNFDIDAIINASSEVAGDVEVEIGVSIGTFVAHHDNLAVVHATSAEDAQAMAETVANAFQIERQRNLNVDAAYGLSELETIAWTSISTSKQNPTPGLSVTRNLRDIMVRWALEHGGDRPVEATSPVVYYRDDVPERLMDVFESILVVSTESMQHQNYAEVIRAFAISFDRLPQSQQRRAADVVLRSLPGLADHILTATLDQALSSFVDALQAEDFLTEAYAVRKAQDKLRQARGEVHARGSRVPTSS